MIITVDIGGNEPRRNIESNVYNQEWPEGVLRKRGMVPCEQHE